MENSSTNTHDFDESQRVSNKAPVLPRIRTEKSEFKIGLNFMGAPKNIGYVPGGFEMALYSRILTSKRLYFGASTSFYPLEHHELDSLFGAFDKIVTRQNIFGLNLGLKYNIIKSRKFLLAVGIHAGTMLFNARSFAQDNTCDCEGNKTSNQTLREYRSARPDYGASLSMEFALKNPLNKIFVDVMRQSPGNTTYLEKDGFEVRPNNIHYSLVEHSWNMMVFKIGYSHYF